MRPIVERRRRSGAAASRHATRRSARRSDVLLLGAMLLAGCERTVVEPDNVSLAPAAGTQHTAPALGEASHARGAPAVLLWNGLARQMVSRFRENPPRAARAYVLLSVAQYDALASVHDVERVAGGSASSDRRAVERAVLAGASLVVLASLFPAAAADLEEIAARERSQPGARESTDTDYARGLSVGEHVMRYAATDGSDAAWVGEVPVGAGLWHSSAEPPQLPLLPLWGAVRPWLMTSGEKFLPPPPPVFGSPEYLAALAEVRRISDTRTPDQLRIARYWADGAGTATPPGHWNAIASDLIDGHSLPEIRAAWVLALVNMALMDASISCWQAKYTYWLIRPSQADPQIVTAVPLPNFPSYSSGHAAFSGAASDVLGDIFPEERAALRAMAEEAALSRVYAGIHYRFDSDRGLAQGRAIARLAIARGRGLHPGGG